jgi:hypothetical protein
MASARPSFSVRTYVRCFRCGEAMRTTCSPLDRDEVAHGRGADQMQDFVARHVCLTRPIKGSELWRAAQPKRPRKRSVASINRETPCRP